MYNMWHRLSKSGWKMTVQRAYPVYSRQQCAKNGLSLSENKTLCLEEWRVIQRQSLYLCIFTLIWKATKEKEFKSCLTDGRQQAEHVGAREQWNAQRPSLAITMKTPKFSGQLDWGAFHAQFELLAGWTEETKALQLLMCRTGDALSFLLLLSQEQRKVYGTLVGVLQRRFQKDYNWEELCHCKHHIVLHRDPGLVVDVDSLDTRSRSAPNLTSHREMVQGPHEGGYAGVHPYIHNLLFHTIRPSTSEDAATQPGKARSASCLGTFSWLRLLLHFHLDQGYVLHHPCLFRVNSNFGEARSTAIGNPTRDYSSAAVDGHRWAGTPKRTGQGKSVHWGCLVLTGLELRWCRTPVFLEVKGCQLDLINDTVMFCGGPNVKMAQSHLHPQ